MKNLWKAADSAEINAKFIWQQSRAERITNLPEVVELQKDTQERLIALGKNVATIQAYAKKIDTAVDAVMPKIEELLQNPAENANAIAKFTEKSNISGDNDIKNMYRTEVIARINKYFETTSGFALEDVSALFVKSMENMKYSHKELVYGPQAKGKLWDAMNMVNYGDRRLNSKTAQEFRGVAKRSALAADMKLGESNVGFTPEGTLTVVFDNVSLPSVSVCVAVSVTGYSYDSVVSAEASMPLT